MTWLWVLAALAVLAAIYVALRRASVARGARERDARILEIIRPVGEKLDAGEAVTPEEVAELAARPHVRPILYDLLKHVERLDLFPEEHRTPAAQAEGILSYWLMHPNDLNASPAAVESVEVTSRELGGETAEFHIVRYRAPEGHWAEKDGWMLGIAGPFFGNVPPYQAAAFARFSDRDGETDPEELTDWYVKMTGG
jgi:hypothetical protein